MLGMRSCKKVVCLLHKSTCTLTQNLAPSPSLHYEVFAWNKRYKTDLILAYSPSHGAWL